MRKWLLLLLALLLTCPALAEENKKTTAEKVSLAGAFAVRAAEDVFAAVPDGDKTALIRAPLSGGQATLVARADGIAELTLCGDALYYLSTDAGATTLVRRAADAALSDVYAFPEGSAPHGLSAYGSELYVLIGDQLHVIYPGNGLCLKLVGDRMSDYVIADGYAYYLSLDDRMTYRTASLLGGEELSAAGGCLYRLDLTSGRSVLLIKAGLESLKYAGGKLYFHNLSDAYVMGSGGKEWMEGRLYSYDIAAQTIKKLLSDYDWGFYPAASGLSVYTANRITWYPEGRVDRPLYEPEGYLQLAGDEKGLLAYDQAAGQLLSIDFDGTVTSVGGDLRAAQTDLTAAPAAEDRAADAPEADEAPRQTAQESPEIDWPEGEDLAQDESSVRARTSEEIFGDAEPGGSAGSGKTETSAGSGKSSGSSGKTESSASGGKSSGSGGAKGTDPSYIFPDSSSRKLTEAEVRALDPDLLGYARNEIYARHGYNFTKGKYAAYFAGKSWYQPGGFSEADLSDTEWYNMELIKRVENGGSQSASGSGSGSSGGGSQKSGGKSSGYIFASSATKKLTRSQILAVDKDLWPYARNEIYARHGYQFKKAKYRNYFSQKSWYSPGGFSTGDLSATEWYNMELLKEMEDEYGVR